MPRSTITPELKRRRLHFSPLVIVSPAPKIPNAGASIEKKSSTGLNRCRSHNEKTRRSLSKHNRIITRRKSNISAERFQMAGSSCSPTTITFVSLTESLKSFARCESFCPGDQGVKRSPTFGEHIKFLHVLPNGGGSQKVH